MKYLIEVITKLNERGIGFKDISLKQMVEGIRTRDGRVLDSGTGISKASVARGLKGLQAKGIIVATHNSSAERGNEPTTYALRFREDSPAPLKGSVCSSTLATPLSQIETRACLTGGTGPVSAVRHTTNSVQQTEEQGTGLETSRAPSHFTESSEYLRR